MSERRKLVAGNWKMNGGLAANQALVQALRGGVGQPACDVAVCPPSVYLAQLQQLLAGQAAIVLGAQDVSQHEGGAFTGKPRGTPAFKAGKIERVEAWLESLGLCWESFGKSSFYSDSHNDLPLMKKVNNPVAVDPDDTLRAHATAQGWPVISLR